MGRAARRDQERAARRQPRKTTPRGLPSMGVPATGQGVPYAGPWWKPRWASDIISELRKVTWPTRQETTHLTMVVIVISLLFAALLSAADFGFSWIVEQTILR